VRKKAKFSGTKKSKGKALTLLLIEGLDRVAIGIKGLLDLFRYTVRFSVRRFAVVLISRRMVFPLLVKTTRSPSLRRAVLALLQTAVVMILSTLLMVRLRRKLAPAALSLSAIIACRVFHPPGSPPLAYRRSVRLIKPRQRRAAVAPLLLGFVGVSARRVVMLLPRPCISLRMIARLTPATPLTAMLRMLKRVVRTVVFEGVVAPSGRRRLALRSLCKR
jgi:hypothetical protein